MTGCSEKKVEIISDNQFVLGTIVSIQIRDHGSPELLAECFDLLEYIEMTLSTSIENSEIYTLNSNAGEGFLEVSDMTLDVIQSGLEYSELSQGRFDITMGPIVNLWGIGTDDAHLPTPADIEDKLSFVNYNDVKVEGNRVEIQTGMMIDLGAIAKGYAADQVTKLLSSRGVQSAIINLGGNVKVLGSKDGKQLYRIGIQSPFDDRNDYLGIVTLENSSVVSSGDYERYFELDGKRYHHIFDSKTGYPVETDTVAVTVVTEKSMAADALSTIFFSLPLEEGMALASDLEGVEVIYIMKDKRVMISKDLEDRFELTDKSYSREEVVYE